MKGCAKMSKTSKIVLVIVLLVLIMGACVGVVLITGVLGGSYFIMSRTKSIPGTPFPLPHATVYAITPLAQTTPEPTEISGQTTVTEKTPVQITSQGKLKALYIGTGDPQFPAGIRLIYDDNESNYKEFSSGEPYEFAKKLFKNARWEIYEDGTFHLVPAITMPRQKFYPLKGTAMVAWNMVSLTNYSAKGPAGDDKNRFDITGNINLDRTKPQLQLVFAYKFAIDKELNFGEKHEVIKLSATVMQEVEKK
jgi:hypothetical protein